MTISGISSSLLPYLPGSVLSSLEGNTTSTSTSSSSNSTEAEIQSLLDQNNDPLLDSSDTSNALNLNTTDALLGVNNTSTSSSSDPLLSALNSSSNNLSTYNAAGSLNSASNDSLLNYLG